MEKNSCVLFFIFLWSYLIPYRILAFSFGWIIQISIMRSKSRLDNQLYLYSNSYKITLKVERQLILLLLSLYIIYHYLE